MSNRTLVITLGQLRAHQLTWANFRKNVLDQLQADLAVCVPDDAFFDFTNPFFTNARFRWLVPDAPDLAHIFDRIQRQLGSSQDWRVLSDVKGSWLGKIAASHQPGAAAILLVLRWFMLANIRAARLTNVYDRFIITRSDFYYLCPHPPLECLGVDSLWMPDGEDYGGLCDRHLVVSANDLVASSNLIDDLLLRPHQMREAMIEKSDWNIEKIIAFHFTRNGLISKLKRFPYIMFLVRAAEDPTAWAPGTYIPDIGMTVKYVAELNEATRYRDLIRSNDDWRMYFATEYFRDVLPAGRKSLLTPLKKESPESPRRRIFTSFGTVLYLDTGLGELRHGPIDSCPFNVILVSEGQRARIMCEIGGSRRNIACQTYGPGSNAGGESTPPAILEVGHLQDKWLGFHVNNVPLCAEPDGRITFGRPHSEAWAWFTLADPPRSPEILEALSLLKPYDIPAHRKKRMGRSGDGGYVILDDLDSVSIVYSIGIGTEISFDLDLANMGKEIFMFDHTIDGLPFNHPRFHFFRQGLAAANDQAKSLYTLAHQVQILGHAGRSDMMMKMDIEGAELDVFSGMPQGVLRQFRQIAMEVHQLHRMNDAAYRAAFSTALSNINSAFTLFHVHANNHSPLSIVNGHTVADLLELSYVRSDLVERVPSKTVYPTVLDFPNRPSLPDHLLWFYPFLPIIEDGVATMEKSMLMSNRLYLQ